MYVLVLIYANKSKGKRYCLFKIGVYSLLNIQTVVGTTIIIIKKNIVQFHIKIKKNAFEINDSQKKKKYIFKKFF